MRVHISLPVSNLKSAVDFYAGVLGEPATKLKADYANFRLDKPGLHLALQQSNQPVSGAENSHFGIELPDHQTLHQWKNRAETLGLTMTVQDDIQCCYARGDKFWLRDPDNRRWEFWVRTADIEADSRAEVCC